VGVGGDGAWGLQVQRQLLRDAHCSHARCDDVPDLVAACLGGEMKEPFYGLDNTHVAGVRGYADFLATFFGGEHAMVVREGKLLKGRDFLDAQTSYLKIVVVLHAPLVGLTTVLEVEAVLDAQDVRPPHPSLFPSLSLSAPVAGAQTRTRANGSTGDALLRRRPLVPACFLAPGVTPPCPRAIARSVSSGLGSQRLGLGFRLYGW
jgi:hypothetical protein